MEESLFSKQLLQCPVCLNEEPATLWPVVNVAADPDLKDKLLRKELLTQVCSNCGHLFLVGQPLLYQDPANRLMIYCHPGLTVEQARMALRSQPNQPEQAGSQLRVPDLPDLSGWQLRLVSDINQMIEKIHITDHHSDDRLIEFIKLAIVRQGDSENLEDPEDPKGPKDPDGQDDPQEPIRAIYFLTANDQTFRFMVAGADQQWQFLDLDSEVYLNAETMAASRLPDIRGKWQVVDQAYARNLLAELAESLAS